jgi:hypothetical protein
MHASSALKSPKTPTLFPDEPKKVAALLGHPLDDNGENT